MSRRDGHRNYGGDSEFDPRSSADHGENLAPAGEPGSNLPPQALEHFKRGYKERADQRDRETSVLNGDFQQRSSTSTEGGGESVRRSSSSFRQQRSSSYSEPPPRPRHRDSHNSDRGSRNSGSYFGGGGGRRSSRGSDRGDDRGGRSQVIMGLDVQSLVDRLCRHNADIFRLLDDAREEHKAVFQSGKAVTAIISNLARRQNLRLASTVWDWIDSAGIIKNTFHYNSMISVCEKVRDYNKALRLLDEMKDKNVAKNEVTFSSAISACEKCGQWRTALDLLDQMKREGAGQTAIAYNAAISACEKGLVPHKALEIFEQMKREGVRPTVVTYSALISAAEKGQQWKLALEVLEEMKAAGHGANVIAYSAAISALSKGQMWHKALELFREIEASGGKPSIVTYNATMTALEKGLQWERALDLFDEMKRKNMPVTVVSYGSAISACEKGLQYRQCLEYLDEMTEMGIKKNVIIFGAAMSCMEKSCRADIAFQLMERMKIEQVAANVHIYNSAISACARCNLWEKGHQLFQEMEQVGVRRDVVTYNAVLDAVCPEVELGRRLFKEGVDKGFYARVSRLGTQWLELDLHFLSLGGGEIALGWWFEECLVPYLTNTSKLEAVQSISIVTGYGKTRSRGARMNDDGMRLRVRAMLKYMNIVESPQPNKGRIHINKAELIEEVKKNNGRIAFDLEGYRKFKEKETTANKFPDVPQTVRARFRPARPGEGPAGTFIREGGDEDGDARKESDQQQDGNFQPEPRDSGRPSYNADDQASRPGPGGGWQQDRRGSFGERERYGKDFQERRGSHNEQSRRGSYDRAHDGRGPGEYQGRRRGFNEQKEFRGSDHDRRSSHQDWERRGSLERRSSYSERERYDDRVDDAGTEGSRRYDERESRPRMEFQRQNAAPRGSYYADERPRQSYQPEFNRGPPRDPDQDRPHERGEQGGIRDGQFDMERGGGHGGYRSDRPNERAPMRQRNSEDYDGPPGRSEFRQKRTSDPMVYSGSRAGGPGDMADDGGTYRNAHEDTGPPDRKRPYDEYQKQQPSRGYNIEPAYSKRRS